MKHSKVSYASRLSQAELVQALLETTQWGFCCPVCFHQVGFHFHECRVDLPSIQQNKCRNPIGNPSYSLIHAIAKCYFQGQKDRLEC